MVNEVEITSALGIMGESNRSITRLIPAASTPGVKLAQT
jgi:hypothetical protein